MHAATLALLIPLSCAVASAGTGATMVVCAPGYPGSTAEAQPAMDTLGRAVTAAAGWTEGSLAVVYFETEAGGLDRLTEPDAVLALVTLPFFLEHRNEHELAPQAQAVAAGRVASERWSLVAGAGRVRSAADLSGWQLMSLAGYSPSFVRGPALGGWGELPASVTITYSGAVLSGLRKAARGEDVALLLDAHQTEAIGSLPFADQLEVVHSSPALPVSLLCSVGNRMAPEQTAELVSAFRSLCDRPDASEALAGVRIERFEEVDRPALAQANETFEGS